MGKYEDIVSQMTWSYSRLTTFETCRYQFLLQYIMQSEPGEPKFFASYGSFMHRVLQYYLSGALDSDDAFLYYLSSFDTEVADNAPGLTVWKNYYESGLNYLRHLPPRPDSILAIEEKFDFEVSGKKFVGIVDLVHEKDGSLIITDHKSGAFKKRSSRAKPTQTDLALDEHLRQLYLYSIPVFEKYGRYPDEFHFNCFRTGDIISEPFHPEALEHTKQWAVHLADSIAAESDWAPSIDLFRCRHLCDVCDQCVYAETFGRSGNR